MAGVNDDIIMIRSDGQVLYLRGDAQHVLQTAAIFPHTQGKISVTLVYGCHPLFQLSDVHVSFLYEIICQLDQHLHFVFSLLWDVPTIYKRVV